MTKTELVKKVLDSRDKDLSVCAFTGVAFDESNSPDGVHGYEVRVVHPDIPSKTVAVGVCKEEYLKAFAILYPEAELPKI